MRQCLVCFHDDKAKKILEKVDPRFQEELELIKCSNCGHVFLKDVPDSFDSRQYQYYKKYRGLPEGQVFNELTKQRHLADLARLRRRSSIESVLDVGCGKGDFIWALKEESLACLGIDLAPEAIEIGQSFGLDVRECDFFSPELSYESFDLITMYELIEHVPNPVQFVRRARDLLRPGGLLYLTTPNFNSVDRFILKEKWSAIHGEHLSYFTPNSMRGLIQSATGLDVLRSQTDNISLELANAIAGKLLGRKKSSEETEQKTRSGSIESIAKRKGIRDRIEDSVVLKTVKVFLNAGLRGFRLGSSMKTICRKGEKPDYGRR